MRARTFVLQGKLGKILPKTAVRSGFSFSFCVDCHSLKEDEVFKHQYFNYNLNQSPIVQLETESIAKRLGKSAIAFGEMEHKPLFDVVAHSCDLIILTSGVTHETTLPVFSENKKI